MSMTNGARKEMKHRNKKRHWKPVINGNGKIFDIVAAVGYIEVLDVTCVLRCLDCSPVELIAREEFKALRLGSGST
jgi:hypothetical protein